MLNHIHIWRLRNLSDVQLDNLKQFNIVYGANGSGKSSFLEALYLLGTGRSFRTSQIRQYIQHKQADAVVYAETDAHRYGLQKLADGTQTIKVDGNILANLSELARQLPVQCVDPEALMLLDDGGKVRRQLLDWLMFHVEPTFYALWLQYQKALKQRNALLKQCYATVVKSDGGAAVGAASRSGDDEVFHHQIKALPEQAFAVWEQQLADIGKQIHLLREKVVADWRTDFEEVCNLLMPTISLKLVYQAGFDSEETSLFEVLKAQRLQDISRGYTWSGVHRADIRVKTSLGQHAEHVLSRGQKKLLIVALKVSQICMLDRYGKSAVVLLDDLSAELDKLAQQRLLKLLASLRSQVFVSTLDAEVVLAQLKNFTEDIAMFHVEHGLIVQTDLDFSASAV